MAADPDPLVRQFLTMNDHLPPELLARVAADPDSSVRSGVIGDGVMSPMPCAGCC
ncbi:hypothetical protein ACFY7Y_41255 [Streptomyces virginiae]